MTTPKALSTSSATADGRAGKTAPMAIEGNPIRRQLPRTAVMPSLDPPVRTALAKNQCVRLVLPTRYTELEPPLPLSAINDDPVFNVAAAASILGVTVECLKRWRQRKKGPDYIQYGDDGPVRYALSALMLFRAHNTVHSESGQ